MALNSVKSTFGAPPVARVFAAATAVVLHNIAGAPPVPGPELPPINHLPAGVIFHNAGNFIWIDADGVTNTTVVPASACGLFVPIAPAQLSVTNAVAVTVFWYRGTK